jgi:hypothetical protein
MTTPRRERPVWFGWPMGLLDEAIREHLELKRRRGADPGEIALQERAALDPVYQAQDAAGDGPEPDEPSTETHAIAADTADADAASDPVPELGLREDAAVEGEVDRWPDAPAATAQETAELDMEAVLSAEDEHDGPQGDPLGAEALSSAATDWGFPTEPAEDAPPEPIPGQERMPFE